jgi:thiamine biosynthesis lipoprotein
MEAAFAELALIDRLMSAHRADSELHRLAAARPARPWRCTHTARVLALAQFWQRESGGCFDPLRAGLVLARRGLRPALEPALQGPPASWAGLRWRSPTRLCVDGALALDFGGIAKGYAVDCALAALGQPAWPAPW